MRTLKQIMANQIALAHNNEPHLLDGDFDDMIAEESLFYESPMELEEMEAF